MTHSMAPPRPELQLQRMGTSLVFIQPLESGKASGSSVMVELQSGTVGMAEHSMPVGELGGKSTSQKILGIIGLAKLAKTSVLAVITSAEKVSSPGLLQCSCCLLPSQYSRGCCAIHFCCIYPAPEQKQPVFCGPWHAGISLQFWVGPCRWQPSGETQSSKSLGQGSLRLAAAPQKMTPSERMPGFCMHCHAKPHQWTKVLECDSSALHGYF